jgi:hypothetical protein
MTQFCDDVLKFLHSEYDDSYQFELELRRISPPGQVLNNEAVVLTIKMSPCYKLKLTEDSMQYIFSWYINGAYIGERNQYRWQKELIDMIEGS